MMILTNPDSPSHFLYKKYIEKKTELSHVYYSFLKDNPFLPPTYEEKLKDILDPRMAQRMLQGKWVEIESETLYYNYSKKRNYINKTYKVDINYAIHISWDFNIGFGKPLSVCLFQYIDKRFHFFDQCVVEGQRTEDSCEEMQSRGLLDYPVHYILNGDQTGRHNDTRNKRSDWEIIDNYFANAKTKNKKRISYELQVPTKNPPIRSRHNLVNAMMRNANNTIRLFVYKDAPTVDEGFRLTKLKKGGQYIEDDSASCPYQHITTSCGYGICSTIDNEKYDNGEMDGGFL